MSSPGVCHCPAFYPSPPYWQRRVCTDPITAEDLLCDHCRTDLLCMAARGININALLDQP